MKITYTIDLEDFFTFSQHLMKTSPLIIKAIRKGQMWWASGPLAAGLGLSIIRGLSPDKTLTTLALLSVTISLPLFLLYKHYFNYRNNKQIRSFARDGAYDALLGTHEMTISADCLAEKTESMENMIEWSSIKKIVTMPEHTFVFVDEATAYIIPHNRIISGDRVQFMNTLMDMFNKRKAKNTTKAE